MSEQDNPYIEHQPGDLLTAEDWNDLQRDIKKDIAQQVGSAVKGITSVDKAKDAHTLDSLTVDQLTDQILQKALAKIPEKTNYRMIFKRLLPSTIKPDSNGMPVLDKISEVKHELKACPLVDVYQLDYFRVLCSTGDDQGDQNPSWVNFYLYHSNEKRIRFGGKTYEVEPVGQQPYKILFKDMLELLKGQNGFQWDDDTTLDDLETDFWKAFFLAPNDEFEEDQFCHSPWFEKNRGELRTVSELKKRGDWDDIWFQMRPRKTINYPTTKPTASTQLTPASGPILPEGTTPAPTQVQVVHFDFNTLGIALLRKPEYPDLKNLDDTGSPKDEWLNVMMLLKV